MPASLIAEAPQDTPAALEARTRFIPELREVLARVDRIAAESVVPDEAEDSPVPFETREKAKHVLEQTASQAALVNIIWIRPSVATTPDGEILVSWRQAGRSLSVLVGTKPDLVLVSKNLDCEPKRQVRGLREAIDDVLSAFRRMA